MYQTNVTGNGFQNPGILNSTIKPDNGIPVDNTLVFDKLAWSVDDVARELNVSVRHVYKLVCYDKIPYCKVGRLVRFSPVRICEWLQKGGTR